jgi:hypothetical protein
MVKPKAFDSQSAAALGLGYMSTGITTQGGTDRLNRILKLYHSTATQILRKTGGGPTVFKAF